MVKILKGDVPAILSSRVSHKEQHNLCLGRDAGVVGIDNEDTKHDYDEVPIYLWNDRLMHPWLSFEWPDDIINGFINKRLFKAAYMLRNKLVLPWWNRNVLR
jgi:hypothetical protein